MKLGKGYEVEEKLATMNRRRSRGLDGLLGGEEIAADGGGAAIDAGRSLARVDSRDVPRPSHMLQLGSLSQLLLLI
ncbi:unnamed protein product [Caenorhabditis auriculariae]|uniref:Uncharacterized protein n=1 Tax=Caenorhabditis auriculariae TaxID=2777116 RepID=A0A8S1HMR1_9PELO|nr:unnamed protein product [Caenorhabditis auriculariae]